MPTPSPRPFPLSCRTLRTALLIGLFGLSLGCSHLRTSKSWSANTVATYRLPDPWIQVDIYEENIGVDKPHYHIRVQSLPVAGEALHYINLEHSSSTRDQVQVSVSPAGLLQRLTYDRYPRGPDVVVALGKAALKAASMFAGVPIKGDGAAPEFSRLVARQVYALDASGNVSAGNQVGEIIVRGSNSDILFTVTSKGLPSAASISDYPRPKEPARNDPAFYYRPLRPVEVTVKQETQVARATSIKVSGVLYVPDSQSREKFWIPTRTVAKQSYDFVFTDGTLSEVAVRKESGLLTVAEVPGQILGTVTGLPAQLLSVEVNHNVPATDPRGDSDDDKGSGNTRPRAPKD